MNYHRKLRADALDGLVKHLNKLGRPMSRQEVAKEMLVCDDKAGEYMRDIEHSGRGAIRMMDRWTFICPLPSHQQGTLQYHKVLAFGRKHKTFRRKDVTNGLPGIPKGTIASSLARAVKREVFERIGGGVYHCCPTSVDFEMSGGNDEA